MYEFFRKFRGVATPELTKINVPLGNASPDQARAMQIQPSTATGSVEGQVPSATFDQMLEAARQHPEAGIENWSDIDRIDLRVDRGIAKLRANSGWEVQVDTATAQVLEVAYRRSDVIETLHDGSFFADWVKLYIFLPTGILLIIMWGTGGYLFLLPRIAKARKKRAK